MRWSIVAQILINGSQVSTNRLELNPEKMELMWSGSRCSLRKLGGRGPAKAQH